MKAITVKYHGPSEVRGSRLIARDMDGNTFTLDEFDHLSREDRYRAAAAGLCRKMGWTGTLAHGGTKDAEVFVFVTAAHHFEVEEYFQCLPKNKQRP